MEAADKIGDATLVIGIVITVAMFLLVNQFRCPLKEEVNKGRCYTQHDITPCIDQFTKRRSWSIMADSQGSKYCIEAYIW